MFSEAECSSNPLQTFNKHESHNRSGLEERVTSSSNGLKDFRSTVRPGLASQEFSKFTESAGPSFRPLEIGGASRHEVHAQRYASSPSTAQMAASSNIMSNEQSGWNSEFARMSIQDRGLEGRSSAPQYQYQYQQQQQNQMLGAGLSQIPLGGYQQHLQHNYSEPMPTYSLMSEHQQVHHEEEAFMGQRQNQALDQAFNQAFDEVEQSLSPDNSQQSKLNHKLEPSSVDISRSQEQEPDAVQSSDEGDISQIAGTIIDTVNSRTDQSGSVANKMKNSKFMSLMNGLATKRTELVGEEFVDTGVKAPSEPARLPDPFDFFAEKGISMQSLGTSFDQLTAADNNEYDRGLSSLSVSQSLYPDVVKASEWEEQI